MQFITFGLKDSLPLNRVFPPGQVASSGQSFLVMDNLLDTARSGPTFLRNPAIAQLVESSIYQGEALARYELHAWVIMPNHVHLLLTPQIDMATLLRLMKGATARQANDILARRSQSFWQRESFDRLVRTTDEAQRIRRYIENNPVRAALARCPEDYRWSSAYAAPSIF